MPVTNQEDGKEHLNVIILAKGQINYFLVKVESE